MIFVYVPSPVNRWRASNAASIGSPECRPSDEPNILHELAERSPQTSAKNRRKRGREIARETAPTARRLARARRRRSRVAVRVVAEDAHRACTAARRCAHEGARAATPGGVAPRAHREVRGGGDRKACAGNLATKFGPSSADVFGISSRPKPPREQCATPPIMPRRSAVNSGAHRGAMLGKRDEHYNTRQHACNSSATPTKTCDVAADARPPNRRTLGSSKQIAAELSSGCTAEGRGRRTSRRWCPRWGVHRRLGRRLRRR